MLILDVGCTSEMFLNSGKLKEGIFFNIFTPPPGPYGFPGKKESKIIHTGDFPP